jgi:hypothetical protein
VCPQFHRNVAAKCQMQSCGTAYADMIPVLRYDDTFVEMDGAWLFAERKHYVGWLEERALS